MSFAGTILRSRAVAALTSPHGVDRYLEQINPMWAAKEVRARVLENSGVRLDWEIKRFGVFGPTGAVQPLIDPA